MDTTLSSRRNFLQVTVRGSVALPLLASLGIVTDVTADGLVATDTSLCLFEADVVKVAGVRHLDLAYQALTLDDATGWGTLLDTLAAASGRSLVVLGRPATVFAARGLLEPAWRVVLEGRHSRSESGGTHHAFNGLEAPMNKLVGRLEHVSHPAQYAVVLASMGSGEFVADAGRTALDLNSRAWSGSDLVSLLAWPRGVA